MLKGKKGWIRIVEASVAILFLAGVMLLVLNQGRIEIGEGVFEAEVHEKQISILRGVQLNESLRSDIIEADVSSDVIWEDASFPQSVKTYIENNKGGLNCKANICSISSECTLRNPEETNIYSESAFISVTTTQSPSPGYNPRKLKLFCWE